MRISIGSLCCVLALAVVRTAQETTYSADSLMSALDKKASLEGTDIPVRDVVVDNKNSKVTFRSSVLGRVICELDHASANHTKPPAVGSTVTVTGKVRGARSLGKRTLDNCRLVAAEAKAVVPAEPADEEIAVTPPEIVSETPPPTPSPAKQLEEPREPAVAASKAKAISPAVKKKDAVLPPKLAQMDIPPKENSTPRRSVPYGFYALLVLSGVLASSILSRLAGAVRSTQFCRPPSDENSPQIRQAALEELLRKSDKNGKPRWTWRQPQRHRGIHYFSTLKIDNGYC